MSLAEGVLQVEAHLLFRERFCHLGGGPVKGRKLPREVLSSQGERVPFIIEPCGAARGEAIFKLADEGVLKDLQGEEVLRNDRREQLDALPPNSQWIRCLYGCGKGIVDRL